MPNYSRGSGKDIPSPPEASDPAVHRFPIRIVRVHGILRWKRCVAPARQTPRLTACGRQRVWRGGARETRLSCGGNRAIERGSNMRRMSHIPLRLTTGAFILNAGYGKRNLDKDSAAGLQTMAAKIIPPVSRLEPETFGKVLSYAEMTLGAALLAPFLPSRLVGVGLGIFSGSLLTMYRRIPGMTQADGIRPSQQGTALAKDVWMFGIAVALVLDRKPKSENTR
jgi:hypothetical protein